MNGFNLLPDKSRTAREFLAATDYGAVSPEARRFVRTGELRAARLVDTPSFRVLEFKEHPSTVQVLADFDRLGLDRPFREDVLRYAKSLPSGYSWLVFLHEPWLIKLHDASFPYVLVLTNDNNKHELHHMRYDGRWDARKCVFPAREHQRH